SFICESTPFIYKYVNYCKKIIQLRWNVQFSTKRIGCRAGHDDAAVFLVPLDMQVAAIHADRHMVVCEVTADGRDNDRAGTRATGLRDAGPPLPYAHADVVTAFDAGEFDVGALGKELMRFHGFAVCFEIDGFGIGNKKHAMRVADR